MKIVINLGVIVILWEINASVMDKLCANNAQDLILVFTASGNALAQMFNAMKMVFSAVAENTINIATDLALALTDF
jgi:hypothetical protein